MKKKNLKEGLVCKMKTREQCLKIVEKKGIEAEDGEGLFNGMSDTTLEQLFGNEVKVYTFDSSDYIDVSVNLVADKNVSQWIPHEFLKKVTKEEIQE